MSLDVARVERLIAESDIRDVCLRYCRGIDRRQFDLVRSCYHPDALDEHGDFLGTVEEFVAHAERSLQRFESTVHFLGNILVEVDDSGALARSECYAVASHRLAATSEKPARDHVVGLRYIDDFERRDGTWRIADRVCAFEWTRTDPVTPGWSFTDAFRLGRTDGEDVVFAASLRVEIDGRRAFPSPTTAPHRTAPHHGEIA
ncbi:MAG: nuclear transport factor 2 family protein [Acidimicrobiales bacterium]|nr:nuclear transport factor 2 family protein [Acidimicrobiales bacterium]